MSVTYGAGGSTRDKTIEIVKRIRDEYGLEAMAHFTCVGRDRRRAARDARRDAARPASTTCSPCAAIRRPGQEEWGKTDGGLEYSRELVELIAADYPFAIGAACFPETHIHAVSPEDDLAHLVDKVNAGVDFLITQLFFDNALYFDFVDRARAAGIEVPIIPGIMPITHVGQVERMAAMCGASIPDGLRTELHARGEDPEAVLDFGVAYATLQCAELLARARPASTSSRSTARPPTRAILSALKLARPWERAAADAGSRSPGPRPPVASRRRAS